jgi:DNA-binding FadR family transcriptional regulator
VLARLRREILLGQHARGARLPPERELAEQLGTNRNTLREALRILESENLVRARQGDGTVVVDWYRRGELALLPWFLAERTPADERFAAVETLLGMRARLLDQALAIAALHGSVEDLDAVKAAIEALRAADGSSAVVAADSEVHRCIVVAARDLVLNWTFNTFAKIFVELGLRFPTLWKIDQRYLEQLNELVRWLEEREPERARAQMHRIFEERGKALADELRPGALAAARERRGQPAPLPTPPPFARRPKRPLPHPPPPMVTPPKAAEPHDAADEADVPTAPHRSSAPTVSHKAAHQSHAPSAPHKVAADNIKVNADNIERRVRPAGDAKARATTTAHRGDAKAPTNTTPKTERKTPALASHKADRKPRAHETAREPRAGKADRKPLAPEAAREPRAPGAARKLRKAARKPLAPSAPRTPPRRGR